MHVLENSAHEGKAADFIVSGNRKIKHIVSMIESVVMTQATVLIRGETGTGKRLFACMLHEKDEDRKDNRFVEVPCGALPPEIIESELFGHVKGSFTGAMQDRKGRFELADKGTILLDDIDALSLDIQVKLLRVLQQKEFERVGDYRTMKVDTRIVATTNQDLHQMIRERRFREDLFYRLNVIVLDLPPLRERKDDIPLLVRHFTDIFSEKNYKKAKKIDVEVIEKFCDYNWPGNIRQLENVIERAVILDTDHIIGKDDIPKAIANPCPETSDVFMQMRPETAYPAGVSLKSAMHAPEKNHIISILTQTNWNKKQAADRLGINRTTLYNKLRKYGICDDKYGYIRIEKS